MRTFAYKGFDTTGRGSRGLIEALDPKEARERLVSRGILPEKIEAAGEKMVTRRAGWHAGFDLGSRAMLYRELSALLRAALPLEKALEILIQAPEMDENRPRLAAIRDQIREGSSLAAALGNEAYKVTPFELAVVEAGERAGTLEQVLERLATFIEEQDGFGTVYRLR